MQRVSLSKFLSLTVLGLTLALLAGPGQAADDKGNPTDRVLYHNLRDVINRGDDLYNGGDWAGCYRLYEGALLAVKPQLEHRKALQELSPRGSPTPSAIPSSSSAPSSSDPSLTRSATR